MTYTRFLALPVALSMALAAPSTAVSQLLPSAPPERCVAVTSKQSASDWLARAAARVLPASLDGRVFRYRASQDVPWWEQSDRMYEPFIPNVTVTNRWYDAA